MRILIISNPERKDFYDYIVERLGDEHELFLLWHYKKSENKSSPYSHSLHFLFWRDYFTPKQLLKKIKPDRVLFFEEIDFWQIPLIIACHKYKTTSFFIEHGVGNTVEQVISRFGELPSARKRAFYYLNKIISRAGRIIHNRIFYLSATFYLSGKDVIKYLKTPFYYKTHTPLHSLSKLKFRKRTPHFALLFSRNNISPFLLYNEIEREHIITEGVPFFDKYFIENPRCASHVVFIEHPYLEEGILGWDDHFHEKVARTLESFATQKRIKIIVKLHPRSRLENWKRYKLNEKFIEIRQKEDITNEMLAARIILGYSSTLLNALIGCKKNVVLLGWHPTPHIFGDDLSKTGLCHVTYHMHELLAKFSKWETTNLAQQNEERVQSFLEEYSYPFDGRATERVIRTIINNEVS
jgi:hypothetical protein